MCGFFYTFIDRKIEIVINKAQLREYLYLGFFYFSTTFPRNWRKSSLYGL